MIPAGRARRQVGLLGLIALLFAAPVAADRLHLESGGVIDTGTWWIEGDWLFYESPAGDVGIPRALVLRIEAREVQSNGTPERRPEQPPQPRISSKDRKRLSELMALAESALTSRDFETAAAAYLDLVQEVPSLSNARVGYAVAEIALGRDGLAQSVILDGLHRDRDHAGLNEILGDLRDREERVEDALQAWKRAFEIAPNDRLRGKLLKGERELHAGRDYDLSHTPHFNLRYDGELDRRLTAAISDFLEEQYSELSHRFRHAPPQPITVLLYPALQFREVTQTPEQVGGLYDGKIRVPLGGLTQIDDRARRLLSHELTHAVVHSKTRGQCPRWLHEGLAQMSEGKRTAQAHRGDISSRLAGDPAAWEAEGFSYPVALALTLHLEARGGFDGLVWLLDQLGEGKSLAEVLRANYGFDYDGLCHSLANTLKAPES
jgi:tetratricopeptide (TPR) repeat protein